MMSRLGISPTRNRLDGQSPSPLRQDLGLGKQVGNSTFFNIASEEIKHNNLAIATMSNSFGTQSSLDSDGGSKNLIPVSYKILSDKIGPARSKD